MPSDVILIRKGIVFLSGLVYWIGVLVHARRVRRQIGRSPNLKPRTPKEKLLWLGWFFVILGWTGQPFLVGSHESALFPVALVSPLDHPLSLALGAIMIIAGHAGTLWCYAALGESWRIGINRREKTALIRHGPYRHVRHPIYLFQIVILAGVTLLLPTPLSFLIFIVHIACVVTKALDEEAYLLSVHGERYRDYHRSTGRIFPNPKSISRLLHLGRGVR